MNSPKQLGDVLFGELKLPHGRKTKTGYSVDARRAGGVGAAPHPVVDMVLEYRQLAKLQARPMSKGCSS